MIIAEHPTDAQWGVDGLCSKYKLKEFDDVKRYSSVNVHKQSDGIYSHQADYTKDLIDSFRLTKAHLYATLLNTGLGIENNLDFSINTREYQRGVGSLQWLSTKTWPDIAFAASLLA